MFIYLLIHVLLLVSYSVLNLVTGMIAILKMKEKQVGDRLKLKRSCKAVRCCICALEAFVAPADYLRGLDRLHATGRWLSFLNRLTVFNRALFTWLCKHVCTREDGKPRPKADFADSWLARNEEWAVCFYFHRVNKKKEKKQQTKRLIEFDVKRCNKAVSPGKFCVADWQNVLTLNNESQNQEILTGQQRQVSMFASAPRPWVSFGFIFILN